MHVHLHSIEVSTELILQEHDTHPPSLMLWIASKKFLSYNTDPSSIPHIATIHLYSIHPSSEIVSGSERANIVIDYWSPLTLQWIDFASDHDRGCYDLHPLH